MSPITPEHQEKLRAGRERRAQEDRERRSAADAAYSAWVKEDARLWRVYWDLVQTRDHDDRERVAAHDAWSDNLKKMPEVS